MLLIYSSRGNSHSAQISLRGPDLLTARPEIKCSSNPMRRGGAKSFVDDLGWSRGVVLSRAATILRSIETQPFRLDDLFASRRAYPVGVLEGSRREKTARAVLFFSPL